MCSASDNPRRISKYLFRPGKTEGSFARSLAQAKINVGDSEALMWSERLVAIVVSVDDDVDSALFFSKQKKNVTTKISRDDDNRQ